MSGHQNGAGSSVTDIQGNGAKASDPEALYALGLHYATGKNGRSDYVAAHKWFNLAAMQGLGRAAANRAELAQEMSHAEIADAQRAAREWLHSHG